MRGSKAKNIWGLIQHGWSNLTHTPARQLRRWEVNYEVWSPPRGRGSFPLAGFCRNGVKLIIKSSLHNRRWLIYTFFFLPFLPPNRVWQMEMLVEKSVHGERGGRTACHHSHTHTHAVCSSPKEVLKLSAGSPWNKLIPHCSTMCFNFGLQWSKLHSVTRFPSP